MRRIVCGFSTMTHLAIIHCVVVVIGLRRIVMFLLLSESVALSDRIFAWLAGSDQCHIIVLCCWNCLYEWLEFCLYDVLVLNG